MEENEFSTKIDINEEELLGKAKPAKYLKVLLIISLIIIVLLIGVIIYLIFFNKKDEKSNKDDNSESQLPTFDTYHFFGTKYSNLPYDENGIINNTFKLGGENYNEEIGIINNGENYKSNELNIYDLYIPRYAENRKNETNGVMLWIHGGWWIGGNLAMTSPLCELYGQLGYISANVNYTLLIDEYKVFNIFRILDEITASIKAIKKELVNRGFKEDKLLLGIGGVSAGGHIALLYSYLIKDINIIPIKFVINNVGPIGLHEEYFYKIKSHDETLDNIGDIAIIEQAKKEGKLVKLFPDSQILFIMNAFWGNKYTKEELNSILDENGKINYEDDKFKKMYKVVKYGYITEVEDKHKLPTICVYGGSDDEIGVSAFAYLKEKMDKDNRPYDYIYSRYEGHILFFPSTEDGQQAVLNVSSLVTKYFNDYFH
jgi:hypothetical protein